MLGSGLLAAPRPGFDAGWVLRWGIVVVLAIMAIGVAVLWLRRKCHPAAGRGGREEVFSLERLESLRRRGELSPEEFRRLRRAALGLDSGGAARNNPALSPPSEDDDEKESGSADAPAEGKGNE